ncbi:MAG: hypothetical protein ACKVRO_14660 [Micropepsaceae bacterium]
MKAAAAALIWAVFASTASACPPSVTDSFRDALSARNEARIYAAANAAHKCLGDPKPETPERYTTPAAANGPPTLDNLRAYWRAAEQQMWWLNAPQRPATEARAPLRVPAAVLRGAAMAARHDHDERARYIETGRKTAAYLQAAQTAAGNGVFPVPAWEGKSEDRVRTLTDRFVKQARARGDLDAATRNGWIIDDRGAGDLAFDNGLAGEALLLFHAVDPQTAYLDAARKAGEWAMRQPLSTNFNYNGFSAALLARLYQATKDRRYRDEAVARIKLGVLPGMIPDGRFAGHWIDPHNERLVYRLIMIRQMTVVVSALDAADPDRAFIATRAATALAAAEAQMNAAGGIAHPATLIMTYCDKVAAPQRSAIERQTITHILASLPAKRVAYDPAAVHCAMTASP